MIREGLGIDLAGLLRRCRSRCVACLIAHVLLVRSAARRVDTGEAIEVKTVFGWGVRVSWLMLSLRVAGLLF